jgi:two-component system sensor histidine kinase KdpD
MGAADPSAYPGQVLLENRARPWVGGAIGVGLSLAIGLVFLSLDDSVTRAVPALLLVVPVVLASAIGTRAAGLATVAAALLALILTLPPIGTARVRLSEDLVALFVFGGVALVINALVTNRIQSLQTVDDQRRALLRSVSHDLRTPLATVRAASTDLRDGTHYDAATRDELLDLVIDEAERLDRLVANLLSMSRIEAGALRPSMTSVDVAELVTASVARVRRRSMHWPMTASIEPHLAVRGDFVQLGQVLDNLLDNAVRHTPPGTAVRVDAIERDHRVLIRVSDDGPGIPAVHRQARRPGAGGAGGFGLVICAAIVDQHAGTIRIDDEPGGGALVTVELPRSA